MDKSTLYNDRQLFQDSVGAVNGKRLYPLTPQQFRIWFLSKLSPWPALSNTVSAMCLRGKLEYICLQQAFWMLMTRHEILRTVITEIKGTPISLVTDYIPTLSFIDLSGGKRDRAEQKVRHLSEHEALRAFDLREGPLARFFMFRIDENNHVVLMNLHHIIVDHYSHKLIWKDIANLYNRIRKARPGNNSGDSYQYADHIFWQQGFLESDQMNSQKEYWESLLKGEFSAITLETDFPRPIHPTFRGETCCAILEKNLVEKITRISYQCRCVLYVTLLTAFCTLLYRYNDKIEDFTVGTLFDGRHRRKELQHIVGMFVNTVVLYLNFSKNLPFNEIIQQVQHQIFKAYDNQEFPFEKIVEKLNPERQGGYIPVIQALFNMVTHMPPTDSSFYTLKAKPWPSLHIKGSQFGLMMAALKHKEKIELIVEYSTDLYKKERIEGFLNHYLNLLQSIATDPTQRLGNLNYLSSDEKHQLLVEWNGTEVDYHKDKCIHQIFEEQAEKTPDTIALVFEDQQLTYRQLNNRANQLARYLQKLGIGPEVLVGVCVERSLEMIIGIIGILKAGGAYVPLDPKYPKDRLSFMLDNVKASILLTQDKLLLGLPKSNSRIICLDANWSEISQEYDTNPLNYVLPENLAYVIYTSGSTGRPKGVAIKHHSTTALLGWAKKIFTPKELACVLASTSICFDLSIFEMFVPLSIGGSAILIENMLQLAALPASKNVTLINTVPSAIAELLRTNSIPASVHTINLAGEPLKNTLVKQLYQLDHINKVFDLYGPSEDTTYSTYALRNNNGVQTIGRPIANTQAYILDNYLNPVPIGISGNLHIGGVGLARGYLNSSDMTAEKFIPNPFDEELGTRLYRTGDLARYLPDGNIDFIGRIDHQVKIRGFRIELGEIESVLNQNPLVSNSVVLCRDDEHGDERLVAYIVLDDNREDVVRELRNTLKAKLPDYMIPSFFVMLDALPLTPNGKVDYKSLPLPDRTGSKESSVAPNTPTEEILAGIWTGVLGVDKVGIHDNFFELGGQSLLAVKVVSSIQKVFEIVLSVRNIFEHPTVAEMAKYVEKAKYQVNACNSKSITPISREAYRMRRSGINYRGDKQNI